MYSVYVTNITDATNTFFKIYIYIYINLPVSDIVGLPHPQSGDSQDQETFLAPSADKQTSNYDTESSNHHAPPYQP